MRMFPLICHMTLPLPSARFCLLLRIIEDRVPVPSEPRMPLPSGRTINLNSRDLPVVMHRARHTEPDTPGYASAADLEARFKRSKNKPTVPWCSEAQCSQQRSTLRQRWPRLSRRPRGCAACVAQLFACCCAHAPAAPPQTHASSAGPLVPVQMWQRGEPSPGADMAGVSPVPVKMWQH